MSESSPPNASPGESPTAASTASPGTTPKVRSTAAPSATSSASLAASWIRLLSYCCHNPKQHLPRTAHLPANKGCDLTPTHAPTPRLSLYWDTDWCAAFSLFTGQGDHEFSAEVGYVSDHAAPG